MNKKHTPGPWEVNHWRQNEGGLRSYGKENGVWYFSGDLIDDEYYQVAAKIDPMKHHIQGDFQGAHICRIVDFKHQDGGQESLANAKLIAAAPDLLKALKELIPLAEDGYALHRKNASHQEFLNDDRECIEFAKEAIKKATE